MKQNQNYNQQPFNPNVPMKICKKCRNQIPKYLKVCPACGKKQSGIAKFIVIGIVIIFIIALLFGGGSDSSTNETQKEMKPQEAENNSDPLSDDIIDVDCGDFHVKYLKHEITKDKSGQKCLAVYYEFTNNSKENKAFIYALSDKCFQNGVEVEKTFFHINDETENAGKEIKPGKTITVCSGFVLKDEKTDIELEIGEWITLKDTPDDKMTLSIKK